MRLVVIGDIHTQADKLWRMLRHADLVDAARAPTDALRDPNVRLVLLGDLFHAKSRARYSALTRVRYYDEYNPKHLAKAERAQEAFLRDVKALCDSVPAEQISILMGNHDYNAVVPEQGPLRTDSVAHLEWKPGYGGDLDPEIRSWVETWPYEVVIEGIHLAHVGPLPEHNRYDNDFYIENRRRWIYEERDFLAQTSYRLGVYGHTPVRGGLNVASKGRAILLDTNGHGDEYVYLDIDIGPEDYRLRMRGLFFDELIRRDEP